MKAKYIRAMQYIQINDLCNSGLPVEYAKYNYLTTKPKPVTSDKPSKFGYLAFIHHCLYVK